jgi:tetratricopeptide (TPR) repeat protein
LLGTDEIQKKAAIKKYLETSHALKNAGDNAANLELWETAYKEYPNEICVLNGLMYALSNHDKKNAARIISIGEKILKEYSDTNYRDSAIQVLCYTYDLINDKDNAVRYANMMGSYCTTQNELLKTVLDGEDAVKKCQNNILQLIESIAGNAYVMTYKGDYTPAESIHAHTFAINAYKLVFEDGDFGFFACRLSDLYSHIAECHVKEGNITAALDNLDEMFKYLIIMDTQTGIKHTSPMVNLTEYMYDDCFKNYLKYESGRHLKELKNMNFDVLREEPRFIKIIADLEKYVNN